MNRLDATYRYVWVRDCLLLAIIIVGGAGELLSVWVELGVWMGKGSECVRVDKVAVILVINHAAQVKWWHSAVIWLLLGFQRLQRYRLWSLHPWRRWLILYTLLLIHLHIITPNLFHPRLLPSLILPPYIIHKPLLITTIITTRLFDRLIWQSLFLTNRWLLDYRCGLSFDVIITPCDLISFLWIDY